MSASLPLYPTPISQLQYFSTPRLTQALYSLAMNQNPCCSPPDASLWNRKRAVEESSMTTRFSPSWITTSASLLVIYLGFFHACIGHSFTACVCIGGFSWLLWLAVCWMQRRVFCNRFEYWIHQVVGLDILFEGFNPNHEGYEFYYCAAGFWLVFLTHHSLANFRVLQSHEPEMLDIEGSSL